MPVAGWVGVGLAAPLREAAASGMGFVSLSAGRSVLGVIALTSSLSIREVEENAAGEVLRQGKEMFSAKTGQGESKE